ncbi:PDDEXK nuclease domain-containing protein [Curtobacterium sp. RRHDQ66]|uniref:PDDEXK nuclease domain-containing protein n=1 Tax=Curtobacterium guangdongense TaxID=3413380 RepID=UPI003BF0DF62
MNTELVLLYWRIGVVILDRQQRSGWGSSVIATLSDDLRAAFPSMTGFSRRNLNYMRALARAWPDELKVQQVVAHLPWGHVTVLLGRFDDQRLRDWYAERAVHHGWSRNVLEHHIRTSAHERFEAAPTNFERALAPDASDLAAQMTKDPYVLDFLALDGDASERALEQRLVERIVETLRELVVVELKTGRFRPDQLGQLSFYVAVVDDRLRGPAHAETVGLLLVADKNESTVRYALGTQNSPVGVASYDLLPPEVRASLPSEDALAGLLAAAAA